MENTRKQFELDGIAYEEMSDNRVKVISKRTHYVGEVSVPVSITYEGILYSVYAIGDKAFADCSELTNITLPNGLKEIGWGAFYGCAALRSIQVPESVIEIDNRAFMDCTALTEVIIPHSIREIHRRVFAGCSALRVLPHLAKVWRLGNAAFMDCIGLTDVVLPEGMQKLGWSVFEGCSAMKTLTIPSSMEIVGDGAFFGCSGLQEITCLPMTPPELDEFAFHDLDCKKVRLRVPADAVETYKEAKYWKAFNIVGL